MTAYDLEVAEQASLRLRADVLSGLPTVRNALVQALDHLDRSHEYTRELLMSNNDLKGAVTELGARIRELEVRWLVERQIAAHLESELVSTRAASRRLLEHHMLHRREGEWDDHCVREANGLLP